MDCYETKKRGLEERAERIGWYIYENNATVRETAQVFQVPKSTVHRDATKILPRVSSVLAQAVKKVLDQNKAEAPIRGGEATKRKMENTKKR